MSASGGEGESTPEEMKEIINEIKNNQKSDEIITCWQDATKMRSWMMTKKRRI